jgi:hypothetical protein
MIKGGLDVNSVVMAKGFQVMKTVFSEESVVLCQSSHQRDVVTVNSVVMGRASGHEDCVQRQSSHQRDVFSVNSFVMGRASGQRRARYVSFLNMLQDMETFGHV